jgi:hypothetical protein
MDLAQRTKDFEASLSGYKATDKPAGQVVTIFNALLAAAKEQLSDDPIVQAIEPVRSDVLGGSVVEVGAMCAVLNQIQSALGSTSGGPFVA